MPEQYIIEYKEAVLPLLKDGNYLNAFKVSLKALKKVEKDLKKTNPSLISRVISLHNTLTALNNRQQPGRPD